MKAIFSNIKITATQQRLIPQGSPTSTSSVGDSLANLFQLLESAPDLTTHEGLSFLISHGFSKTKDPDIYFSKTSKVYLATTLAKLSRQYLGFSPTLGMECNGRYLIQKTTESPKTGNGCSLSDILEDNPDPKYFLSKKATQGILNHKQRHKEKGNGFGAKLHQL